MGDGMLVTSAVSARRVQRGRAILTARGHHVVCDSPPPLGGPNEELNPIEFLLGALAACGVFVCERAAQEQGMPLRGIEVVVAADFDPRGICGEPVDPRLQTVRVRLAFIGITGEQGSALQRAFTTRCPVYATVANSAEMSVEVEVRPQEEGA